MSSRIKQGEEKVIPVGLVFLTIGSIILTTVAAIWWIDTRINLAVVGLIPTAVPFPASLPPTQPPPASEEIALLPETPLLPDYPPHYVSALEAAVPNSGQPTRIVIPQIELDAPISSVGLKTVEYEGNTTYQWMVPSAFKAGWHNTSARLGEAGNTVLNGHHNIYGEVFRDLIDLEEGDTIILHDPGKAFTYQVSQVMILEERDQPLAVRQENAKWIGSTNNERITLITCWPYTDNSHRVIVVAHPTVNQIEEVTHD